jgi:rhodanese-related sulfurtransferase
MTVRAIAASLAVLLLALVPTARAQESPKDVPGATTVDAAAAKSLFDRGAKFVDVRGKKFWKISRIPGAASLDAIIELSEASLTKFAGKNDEVVFYCSGPG